MIKVERVVPPEWDWPLKKVTYTPTGAVMLNATVNSCRRLVLEIKQPDIGPLSIGMSPDQFDQWVTAVRTLLVDQKAVGGE